MTDLALPAEMAPVPAARSWMAPGLVEAARQLVFPGLVVAVVIGNQYWTLAGFSVGQMLSWFVDAAAVVILADAFPRRVWPLALGGLIIATRLAGSGFQGSGTIDFVYLGLLNGLFCLVGAIMAIGYTPLVRRQLEWMCLASLIMMILQMTGVGEWTQFLAIENNGLPKTAYPTLFVDIRDLIHQTIQQRPSGLFSSNNYLSMFVIFGLVLRYGNPNRYRLSPWDYVLAAMAVVAMAKIVFLVQAMMIAWLLIVGTGAQRVRMIKALVLWAGLFAVYWFLFPGLFEENINPYTIAYSFFIRANEFLSRIDINNPISLYLIPYFKNTPTASWDTGAGLSGFTQIQRFLPQLIAAAAVGIPFYLIGLRRLKARLAVGSLPILAAIAVVVYPGAVPIWNSPVYWFIAGFAALPLVALLAPRVLPDPEPAP